MEQNEDMKKALKFYSLCHDVLVRVVIKTKIL